MHLIVESKLYIIAKISDDVLQVRHGATGAVSEVDYRLAWSRTYLKKIGLLENSARGIWALSKPDIDTNKIDPVKIVKTVREQSTSIQSETTTASVEQIESEITSEIDSYENWKEQLLDVLYNITPAAFERLSQRLLRESGFFQVEVTGKAGDGGIDGKGIVRVNELLSFPVIFQCKRYRGSVSPSQIRDFRGAMQGRTDIGLFITTGTFTREANKEANRDGAPPINLINGEMLCDKLKELNLGVETKLIETVDIKNDWFNSL